LYTNIALQKGRYKLVGNADYNASADKFELFDIEQDPFEQNKIVKDHPDRVAEMKKELDLTFRELAISGNLVEKPRIEVESVHENPVILNRNDADGQWGIWEQEEIYGLWRVKVRFCAFLLNGIQKDLSPLGGGRKSISLIMTNRSIFRLCKMENISILACEKCNISE